MTIATVYVDSWSSDDGGIEVPAGTHGSIWGLADTEGAFGVIYHLSFPAWPRKRASGCRDSHFRAFTALERLAQIPVPERRRRQ